MAAERFCVALAERGVLEVSGADRVGFLQGLVSNDVTKAAADRAVYAALLTAQGRYLHDFFIVALGEALYLDSEASRLDDLRRRLAVFKLRSKVALADAGDRFVVAAGFGSGAAQSLGLGDAGSARGWAGGVAYVDPRLAALGVRFLVPRGTDFGALGFASADAAAYDRMRLSFGIPDGSRDLPPEKALLLEAGFDELNGVDWQKGCYMGQELTARMKYRALIKKRLLPVAVEGEMPPPGSEIKRGTEEAGELRSGRDGHALALLRLDAVEAGGPLTAGSARLTPQMPGWIKLAQEGEGNGSEDDRS